jgi:hypothetical protein
MQLRYSYEILTQVYVDKSHSVAMLLSNDSLTKKVFVELGMMVYGHTCKPSTWEVEAGRF